MQYFHRGMVLSIRFILASMLALTSWKASLADQTPSRADVRDALARWWEAIDGIEIEYDLTIDVSPPYKREYHLALTSGGKYSAKGVRAVHDGSRDVFINERTDGKLQYQQGGDSISEGDVSRFITVGNTRSTPDLYHGSMNDIFWLILPGGRPLHKLLDDESEFLVEPQAEGPVKYIVSFSAWSAKNNPVRCELDPEHDWIPMRVEVGSRRQYVVEVDRFRRVKGLFFPTEGRTTSIGKDGAPVAGHFLVRRLDVNESIDPKLFGPPGVVPGTLVMDQVRGTNYSQGGLKGREAFDKKYGLPSSSHESEADSRRPLSADPNPPASILPTIFFLASALVVALAVYLRREPT